MLAVKRLEDSITARAERAEPDRWTREQWYSAATTYMQAIRGVEAGLLDQVVSTTRNLRSDAQRQAITTGVIIAAILVIAFLTSLLIARSMIGPLRRLQAGARDVAEVRLPEAIARLQRPDAPAAPDEVEPIGIDSRDEIGEVARTFDELHQRAVELASEQAGLRRNVNDMFVNLSRRSQGLVERQLKLIDELETGEQDPDQLANLFKLDHLATRMRRNSENLLVLAGEDAGRRWGRPIPLVDVLRAATSEVEQYHRIQLTGVPDVEVMGHAVNRPRPPGGRAAGERDGVLLARVQGARAQPAAVRRRRHGRDRGPRHRHEPARDLRRQRAAGAPAGVRRLGSRMMGLYVVGRLATRHGITVRLRQSETGGVSAFVRIPIDVLANRFDPQAEDTAGGPPPLVAGPDGRTGRRPRWRCRPRPARSSRPARGRSAPARSGDLPPPAPLAGRPGGPPDQPAAPGSPGSPLPRRTPAQAAGGDGASAGGVESVRPDGQGGNALPVNGAMPANGIPSGRPVLPPGGAPVAPAVRSCPAVRFRPAVRSRRRSGSGRRSGPSGDRPARPPLPCVAPLAPAPARGRSRRWAPVGRRPLDQPYQQAAVGAEERTPIFEQLQSEWFRQRPASPRSAPQPDVQAPTGGRRPAAGYRAGGERGSLGLPGRRGLAGGRAAAAADQRRHHPGRPADAGAPGPPHARRR